MNAIIWRLSKVFARSSVDSYTQFAIQDSRLFGPNPRKVLAPPSNYLSKKVSRQPNPWRKSWYVKSCYANWVSSLVKGKYACITYIYIYIYVYIHIYIYII